jgi:hypothetical protein
LDNLVVGSCNLIPLFQKSKLQQILFKPIKLPTVLSDL